MPRRAPDHRLGIAVLAHIEAVDHRRRGQARTDPRPLDGLERGVGYPAHLLLAKVWAVGIDPRDEVRVRTVSGVDPEVVGKALVKAGITNSVVTPDVEQLQARLSVPENASLGMFAQAYVDAQDTPLDKVKLMKVFEEVRG